MSYSKVILYKCFPLREEYRIPNNYERVNDFYTKVESHI